MLSHNHKAPQMCRQQFRYSNMIYNVVFARHVSEQITSPLHRINNSQQPTEWSAYLKRTGSIYEFQATLSTNVCYCITADETSSLHFIGGGSVSVDYIFKIMLGSKENSQHFFFSVKSTLILINLLIYRTTQHTPHYRRKSSSQIHCP